MQFFIGQSRHISSNSYVEIRPSALRRLSTCLYQNQGGICDPSTRKTFLTLQWDGRRDIFTAPLLSPYSALRILPEPQWYSHHGMWMAISSVPPGVPRILLLWSRPFLFPMPEIKGVYVIQPPFAHATKAAMCYTGRLVGIDSCNLYDVCLCVVSARPRFCTSRFPRI